MNKKNILIIMMLIIICAIIIVMPLLIIKNSEFAGADAQAEDEIIKIDPDYVPWFNSIITLPGSETETLIFCLQTALGSVVIGYGFGYFVARKKYEPKK